MAAMINKNGGSPGHQLKAYRNRSFGLILLLVSNGSLHHAQLAAASHYMHGMASTVNGLIYNMDTHYSHHGNNNGML